MKYETQENGNRVITTENGIYTFVDMGDFVGHSFREWYDESPEFWKLMFYDSNDDRTISIEALVDQGGNYMKFFVSKGNERRVVTLDRGFVSYDSINEYKPEKSGFSDFPVKSFYSVHKVRFEQEIPRATEYFGQSHEFVSEEGETYSGDLASDFYVLEFIKANDELLPSIVSVNEEHKER